MARNTAQAAPAATSPLAALLATLGEDGLAELRAALGVQAPTKAAGKGKGKGKKAAKVRQLPAWAQNSAQVDVARGYKAAKMAFLASRTLADWAAYSAAWDAYNALRPELLTAKFARPGADGATTGGKALVAAPAGKGATLKPVSRESVRVAASEPRKSPVERQAEKLALACMSTERTLKAAVKAADSVLAESRQPVGIVRKLAELVHAIMTPENWAAYQAAR